MREITVFIKHRLDIIFILTIYTFHFIPKSYHSKIIPDFKQDVRKIRAPLKPIFDLAAANISKQIIYVEEGEKVEISCAPELYSFNDTIKLEWFKNSNPLDKSEPTIMIEKVTRSMMGTTFRCAMYNQSKFPYMYKDMKILVEWGPKVQINPLVIETDRQGQIDISCYADAFPAPLIKWYFDLSQTSATDELVYESTGLYLNITTNDLENCRFHNRNLTCSASNTLKNLAKPGSLPERTDKRILSINIQVP
ncbi:uncharacterized protein LOC135926980 [Gordionus sp. m RMFG-2023]|uniref:uncharacterized protein LOC135926980 n=1 Tax=Gordionus sp. m RMFG-2023 TaxID=3053472 RepID=UPI0031FD3D00